MVGVEGAALGVDDCPLGGVGALVDAVRNGVAVRVERAAILVDRPAPGRIGALVEPFHDAVAVEVPGAAVVLVDQRALGSVGAAIADVEDAVAVRIVRRAAAEDPGQAEIQVLVVKALLARDLALEFGPERHVTGQTLT